MVYFDDAFNYLKDKRKNALISIGLDALFYVLFLPILLIFAVILSWSFNQAPLYSMNALMQSVEGSQMLAGALAKAFFGMIFDFLLLGILILLNFSIMRAIVWHKIMEKKIKTPVLFKSALLSAITTCIFIIPLVLSFLNLMQVTENGLVPKPAYHFTDLIPFVIVMFFTVYFSTLANYFVVKEGSVRKALKNCFYIGFTKIGKLILPFIGMFAIVMLFMRLLGYLGFLTTYIGLVLVLLLILIISFFNRVYLSKTV